MIDQRQRRKAPNNSSAAARTPRTRPAKIERWPRAQFQDFMRRLLRAIYEPSADLPQGAWLGPAPSSANQPLLSLRSDAEVLEAHFKATWTWVLNHSAFRLLKSDPLFQRAWRAFQRQRDEACRWATPKDPRAACEFVYIVALWIGVSAIPGLPKALTPRDVSGKRLRTDKRRTSARRHIEHIEQRVWDKTIDLGKASNATLLDLLLAAKEQLERPRRKPPQRRDLYALAAMLNERLGVVSTNLLMEVASVAKIDCDERTVRRHLTATRGD